MNNYRKPKLNELRPGDVLEVTNKDVDKTSDFLVEERTFLRIFKLKVLVELKLYSEDIYPLFYLDRKEIYWKLKDKT